jgi:hypothetical protein
MVVTQVSVPQTVVRGPPIVSGGSPGGPQAVSDCKNGIRNLKMKNTSTYVCIKTAFFG